MEIEQRLRLLVEAKSGFSFVLLDPGGRITSWSSGPGWDEGEPQGDPMGQPFSRFFPEPERAAGKLESMLAHAATQGRWQGESWRVGWNGRRFLAHMDVSAFHDAEGTLRGFAVLTHALTEGSVAHAALQALAEALERELQAKVQALGESEARLRGLIHHAPVAIAFKGLDGRLRHVNPRMEALLDEPAGELLGAVQEGALPGGVEARARARDERVLASLEVLTEEETWTHRDGSVHDYLVIEFPILNQEGQGTGVGVIVVDMTEKNKADRALLHLQKLESLGVLTGGIAHDFNNLLGAMLGNVELAMTAASLAEAQPHLETLKGLLAKGSGLLQQMMAYAGRGEVAPRRLDLNQLVEEMVALLGASLAKKAEIRLGLAPAPLLVEADPAQLQQVVMNLVINASEAMAGKPGLITLRTDRESLTQGDVDRSFPGQPIRPGAHAVLEVADTGTGMTPEVMARIFDPFFTTKVTGRGLGLAAMQGIIRRHHGGIQVASEPGRGTTFRVLLPAAPAPALAEAQPDPPPRLGSRETDRHPGVLVVEDEEALRAVVAQALTREGITAFEARDGLEALAVFQKHQDRIQLILMDLAMPRMDGEEACRELRRLGATVPILVCSGSSQAELERRFSGLDLAGFVQKPFDMGTLFERVGRVLGG